MSYRRNLRRLQRKRQKQAECGGPFLHLVEMLSIRDALLRPDLAPLVMHTLKTAYLVRKTGARLDPDTCLTCDQTWQLVDPVLALVVTMPEDQAAGVSLVCVHCARCPDLRERAVGFLRRFYGADTTMRVAHGPHWT
jgi:hypothetical protein